MRAIHPGELITCLEGHVVGEVLPPFTVARDPDTVRVGMWRPGQVSQGKCVCSAPFWRMGAWHVNNRGWVEI